jgi:hypothetical protein
MEGLPMKDVGLFGILRPFGKFYGYLEFFGHFDIYFPVLVCCTKKNLATLEDNSGHLAARVHFNVVCLTRNRDRAIIYCRRQKFSTCHPLSKISASVAWSSLLYETRVARNSKNGKKYTK